MPLVKATLVVKKPQRVLLWFRYYQLPSQIKALANERLAVLCKQVGVHVHYYHSTHPGKLMHQLTSPDTPAHQPYSLLRRIQMTDCTNPAPFGHVLKSFFDMQQQAR